MDTSRGLVWPLWHWRRPYGGRGGLPLAEDGALRERRRGGGRGVAGGGPRGWTTSSVEEHVLVVL
jgi:hypothetical protein